MADALMETVEATLRTEPKLLGWRRLGFGEPLARFNEQFKHSGKGSPVDRQRWREVRERLEDRFRSAEGSPGSAATAIDNDGQQQAMSFDNVDETIDALLEEEICQDEASWLDIGPDVLKVKGQVV